MQVELHLGTYKTGTTTIQNTLFRNRDSLARQGILFPDIGLARSWKIGHRHRKLVEIAPAKVAPVVRDLVAEMERIKARKTILSYEGFVHPLHASRLNALLREFENCGVTDFHGVLVLRNLPRYVVSHYREFTVHQNNRLEFRKYLDAEYWSFDYLVMLQTLHALLDGRLTLINFERHDDIYPAFCAAAGLPEALTAAPVERANVKDVDALDVEAIRIARVLNLPMQDLRAVVNEFRLTQGGPDRLWTERRPGDILLPNAAARSRFARLSGWPAEDLDLLFSDTMPQGDPVDTVAEALGWHLAARLAG